MTLTTVVGSSGSGKTTFLNDVHKSHKCTYIRQYHNLRPYIAVSKIPNFDPTTLPFWEIYEKENKAGSIQVGGTMAGEFTPGFSGGQRKLLLFELIYQRTMNQKKLLLVFDEPFAGVTDDFVPWIVDRLNLMRQKHNILLVTNDHVQALSEMADNVLTVSAIDRTKVKINDREHVDREKAILALSVGNDYHFASTNSDLMFFLQVEVWNSQALMGIFVFTMFTFLLFLLTFWDSQDASAALVLIGAGIIAYFAINPYLLSLVDWRNYMGEEAEALLHSSKGMNKLLKTLLTMSLVFMISFLEYGFVNAVVGGLEGFDYWVAIFFDSASMTFPFMCFGLYTDLPFQAAQILGSFPFLFMIFFSTTFSPNAGVPVVKELRYLFARFYFWCMVPVVDEQMEGCPADRGLNLLYLCLSGMIGVVLFIVFMGAMSLIKSARKRKEGKKREAMMDDDEFHELQLELYGEQQLRKLLRADSSGSMKSVTHTMHSDIANNVQYDIEV
jgi:ABC-type lipoprotein export system ATPase subunit